MADPFLDQMQAMLTSQSASEAATRKMRINQGFLDYGAVPDLSQFGFTSPYLNDLNPETAGLAAQNTASGLSVLGRLNKQHADIRRRNTDELAARGILRSGETGYREQEEALRHQQANYDASKQLVEFLSGAMSVFQQGETGRAMTLLEAQQQAAFRAQDLAFRQQEMAQQAALAQQQMAMSQSGGGGDSGGGFDFSSMFGGGDDMGGGGMVGPSQQEMGIMAAAAKKAARHRTPQEQQLFGQYADWRNSNPNWWK